MRTPTQLAELREKLGLTELDIKRLYHNQVTCTSCGITKGEEDFVQYKYEFRNECQTCRRMRNKLYRNFFEPDSLNPTRDRVNPDSLFDSSYEETAE